MTEGLRQIFVKYGIILSSFVHIDIQQRRPYAFVCFDNHESAKQAIKELGSQSSSDPLNTGRPIYVTWAQCKKDRQRAREGQIKDRYIFLQNLKQEINDEMVRTAFSKFGEIATVRLSKLNVGPFMGTIKIGYVVFKMAISAHQTINKYEGEGNEDIIQLFEGNPIVSYLFTPSFSQRDKKQNHQRRVNHRMMQLPMGPMPMPMQGMNPMMPPGQYPPQMAMFQQQQQPFIGQQQWQGNPQHQKPRERSNSQKRKQQQQQHGNVNYRQQYEYVPTTQIPYNEKPDLLELIKNMNDFKSKPEDEQRKKLGQMLLGRTQIKMKHLTAEDHNSIVAMLIDEQFEIDEIIDILKDEKEFNERMEEAEQTLKEDDNEK